MTFELDETKLNEAMEAVQAKRLAALTSPPPVDEAPAPLPDEPVKPPVEEEIPTPDEPLTIEIDGKQVPLEEVQAAIQWNEVLRNNPALFNRIQEAVRTPLDQPYNPNVQQITEPPASITPPAPPVLELPEDLDLEDPATRYMVSQFKTLQDRQVEYEAQMSQYDAHRKQQESQYVESAISSGRAQFQTDNPDITPDELLLLEEEIGRTQILAGLRSTNPNQDLSSATKEAFERTMWATPSIRDRLLHAKEIISLEQHREDQERARKLSALSGSTSNTPRVPTPTTPADKKASMINEIAAAMSQRAQ